MSRSLPRKNFYLNFIRLVADAGYGSEQNYSYPEDNNVEGYVKYNYFDKDQHGAYEKKHPFVASQLHYNKEQDVYYCPMGQQMKNIGITTQTTAIAFKQTITRYQATNCEGCPLRVHAINPKLTGSLKLTTRSTNIKERQLND